MNEYKDLLLFESICHTYGLDNPQEKAELMLRVLKTRQQIGTKVTDAETLYKEMQKATLDMPRFKGDSELFFQIYSSLVKIDAHGILFFLTKVNQYDRGHLSAPDIIVKKFGEYITPETKTVFIPECESYGMALLDEIENHPEVSFTLSTRNEYWKDLLSYVYSEYENVSLVFADIYRDGFSNDRYDLIFAIPVFGSRSLAEGQDFICKDSEMIIRASFTIGSTRTSEYIRGSSSAGIYFHPLFLRVEIIICSIVLSSLNSVAISVSSTACHVYPTKSDVQ